MLLISAVQLAEDALWALWDNPQGVQFILKKPTAWATLSYKLRSQAVFAFAACGKLVAMRIESGTQSSHLTGGQL